MDLNKKTKKELIHELAIRGLDTSGLKKNLIKRLKEILKAPNEREMVHTSFIHVVLNSIFTDYRSDGNQH